MLSTIIRKELVSCSKSSTIHEVALMMKDKDVGAVLVTDSGKPVGIVTDRDLVLRCIADKADCGSTKIEKAMTATVQTVSEEEGLYNVAEKMKKAGVRRIPIVDKAGKAVALLSFDDVFQLIAEEVNNLKEAVQPKQPKIVNQAE